MPRPRGATTGDRTPIPPRLLGRFLCDALLERVLLAPDRTVLALGYTSRTFTPAQKRALAARDRGCVIPGCTAPPHWCDGHHVTWWSNHGPTDLDNGALLCSRHHTEVHLGGIWDLKMINGHPWVRPPSWVDPHRRPVRNAYTDDAETAHRLGTQLLLDLDDDAGPWP